MDWIQDRKSLESERFKKIFGGSNMLNFKKITKKAWKKIGALTLAGAIAVMGVNGGTVAQASDIKSQNWSATKTPGYTGNPSDTCTLTYYAGTVKFYTYSLIGGGYVYAKCKGVNCTIDNDNKYVRRSVASKTAYTSFTVKNNGKKEMTFKVTIIHDGDISTLVSGTGKICYD